MSYPTEVSPQRRVREFHEKFRIPINADNTREVRQFRWSLIVEEYLELFSEMWEGGNLQAVAKELADLLYVLYGTAVTLGIDLDQAFRLVHESNMSKVDDEGNPMFREDGKVLKGPNYRPPDLSGVVPPSA